MSCLPGVSCCRRPPPDGQGGVRVGHSGGSLARWCFISGPSCGVYAVMLEGDLPLLFSVSWTLIPHFPTCSPYTTLYSFPSPLSQLHLTLPNFTSPSNILAHPRPPTHPFQSSSTHASHPHYTATPTCPHFTSSHHPAIALFCHPTPASLTPTHSPVLTTPHLPTPKLTQPSPQILFPSHIPFPPLLTTAQLCQPLQQLVSAG